MRTVPPPGGQVSEMAGHEHCCGRGGWAGVWHLLDLPTGLPHSRPGAEPDDLRTGSAEGCPRAAVWSGWRQIDEIPHSTSVQGLRFGRSFRAWPKKLPTQNQMFGRQIYSRSKPTAEEAPDLHQLVHQRLRTTMDVPGLKPDDEARPWMNYR
jgi:hypothetical protein